MHLCLALKFHLYSSLSCIDLQSLFPLYFFKKILKSNCVNDSKRVWRISPAFSRCFGAQAWESAEGPTSSVCSPGAFAPLLHSWLQVREPLHHRGDSHHICLNVLYSLAPLDWKSKENVKEGILSSFSTYLNCRVSINLIFFSVYFDVRLVT